MNDILSLEKIIASENLEAFRYFVGNIKNTPLHQQLKKHYGTQNLLIASQEFIKKSNQKIMTKEVLDLALLYLNDNQKSDLIKTCVLADKMEPYQYLKEEIGDKFYHVISNDLSSIGCAWREGNPEFKVWIKNTPIKSQPYLEGMIRGYTLGSYIPLSHVNYFASRLEKIDILYETLAYASRDGNAGPKIEHLFGLLVPDLDSNLLLQKLKKSLNIEEQKHESLKTDNLLEWCDNYSKVGDNGILILKNLLNSFYLHDSLQSSLKNHSDTKDTKKNKI